MASRATPENSELTAPSVWQWLPAMPIAVGLGYEIISQWLQATEAPTAAESAGDS